MTTLVPACAFLAAMLMICAREANLFTSKSVVLSNFASIRPVRSAIPVSKHLWKDKIVHYKLSRKYTRIQRWRILAAMRDIERKSCISFLPSTRSSKTSIYIYPDKGPRVCSSFIGMQGTKNQLVELGSKCLKCKGTIQHELMHVLGFFHEHNRADRDKFVKILWKNVKPKLRVNFKRFPKKMIDHLGTSYDYGSLMHYWKTELSKNGQSTIVPLRWGTRIGQRERLSAIDIERLNRLYQCRKTSRF